MRRLVLGFVAMALLVWGGIAQVSCRDPAATELARALYLKLIPLPGTPTSYGIPISLWNVDRFAGWYRSIRLSPREEAAFAAALTPLVVPPCGDSLAVCCRPGSHGANETPKICTLVHSAQGLAKWLVHARGFPPEKVRAAVDQWLHFVFSSYYLAQALAERGVDPASCGLPLVGKCCHKGYCDLGSAGGCEVISSQGSEVSGGG